MISKLLHQFKPFLKYSAVGASGTVIDVGLLYLLVEYSHLDVLVATTISFVAAVINNFTWNKLWTFANRDSNIRKQFIKFLLVSLVGLVLNTFFMFVFVRIFVIWYIIAKLMTSFIVLSWNFLGNKYWAFRMTHWSVEVPSHFDFEFSIVIPAYNEEHRIKSTLLMIHDYLSEKNISAEIIVVSDGSTDGTGHEVKKKKEHIKNLQYFELPHNHGKGHAIRTGIEAARGRYILFTDADNSTPIVELEKFLPHLQQFHIVLGSRWLKEGSIKISQPWYRIMISRIGNFFIRLVLLEDIKDTQCGFKCFHHRIAKEIFARQKVRRFAFDIEALAIAKGLGYTFKEIPVDWYNSPESRLRPIRDALRTFKDLIYIKLNTWSGRYR